jgi:hypothetical protein
LGYLDEDGYGHFSRTQYDRRRAHRFSRELEHGVPAKKSVLHRCDNRACVRPSHLFEGTQADNVRDRDAKKRNVVGAAHPLAKLTDEKVRKLRRLCSEGVPPRVLAKTFGVTVGLVDKIVRRVRWAHVD